MNDPKPTLTIADAAERISEKADETVSAEWVRRQIKAGRLFAARAGGAATSPWMLHESDVERFAEREAHKRRVRKSGIVAGYGPAGREAVVDAAVRHQGGGEDEKAAELRRLNERDQREEEEAAQRRRREEIMARVEREMLEDPSVRQRLEQLDDEARVEAEAREVAARVRRAERIQKRAREILDEEGGDDE